MKDITTKEEKNENNVFLFSMNIPVQYFANFPLEINHTNFLIYENSQNVKFSFNFKIPTFRYIWSNSQTHFIFIFQDILNGFLPLSLSLP